MDIRKQIREAFIEMKVYATEKDYKKIRNKAHTMIAFIDDYWVNCPNCKKKLNDVKDQEGKLTGRWCECGYSEGDA